MNMRSLVDWLEKMAVEQLVGVVVGSTLLCIAGCLAAAYARKQSAAVRFCIWQMVGCAIIATTLILLLAPGIPLRSPRTFADLETADLKALDPRMAELTEGSSGKLVARS